MAVNLDNLALGRGTRPKSNTKAVSMKLSEDSIKKLLELARIYDCEYGGSAWLAGLFQKIANGELVVVKKSAIEQILQAYQPSYFESNKDLIEAIRAGKNIQKTLIGRDWSSEQMEKIDLSGFNLAKGIFHSTNLELANLQHANLTKADLSRAWCKSANFKGAILIEANLTRVNFSAFDQSDRRSVDKFNQLTIDDIKEATGKGADLSETNLTKANLSDSYLGKVNLSGANLNRAIITGAKLNFANLSGANLTNIQGLEEAIDVETADFSNATLDVEHKKYIEKLKAIKIKQP